MHTATLAKLSTLAFLAAPAAARQEFQLALDPQASSVALEASLSVELPGSVIGNYDAVTNPRGTRTVPGLGGGPGNEPVSMDLGLSGDTDFDRTPLGGLVLDVDVPALSVEVRELELDLLGGVPAASAITLSLLYSTFRTYQPDSLYIGGIPLDLPLGEQAISAAQLAQDGAAVGALVATRDAGVYELTVLVPAQLSFVLESTAGPVPVGPLAVVLPLSGLLTVSGDAAALAVAFDLTVDQTVPDPLPGFTIDDAPLDLPTILPPGNTAFLLFDATIASLSVASELSVGLVAAGSAACGIERYCAAEQNSTGAAVELDTTGVPDASANDLTFLADGLPPNTMGFFVMSTSEAFVPSFRGHVGNLCLGPRQVRFAQDVLDSGPGGAVSFSPDFADLPNGVDFLPGSTWHFQLWYRDQDPGPTWNSSDGVRVRFCAAD